MILLVLASILPLPAGAEPPPTDGFAVGTQIADVTISSTLIIRVPPRKLRAATPPISPFPVSFREKKGPTCIESVAIGGAAVTAPDSVDFTLKGGQRVRAKLEEACPALDFYTGFYVRPGPDGKICADRDSIHTRSGGVCEIDRFRKLVPAAAR